MENKVINQKEYLKKYMRNNDEKKKKKKKKQKTGIKTVKIIDDDVDLKNMRPIEEGEFDILLEGEDAPQIAGIVDERGPIDFSDKKRWKIITENEEGDLTIINRTDNTNRDDTTNTEQHENDDFDLSPLRHSKNKQRKQSKNDDSDLSPSRHSKNKHKKQSKNDDSDLSPPRHSKNKHKKQSKNDDSDLSPPRHSKDKHVNSSRHGRFRDDDSDLSPPRHSRNNHSDLSPPRKSKNNDDSDLSPPRRSKNSDSDLSPPRKDTKHRTSAHSSSKRNHRSLNHRDSDSDISPPRKHKQNPDTDLYESRRSKKDSDSSASRHKEHRSRRDDSPRSSLRKSDRGHHDYRDKYSSRSSKQDMSRSNRDKREREYEDRDRKSRSYSDTREKRRKKSRWDEETDDFEHGRAESQSKDSSGRMTKTLDGKTAGLQDARALREETESHKRREVEQFNKLSKAVSGIGQAPIMRDKTGKKRNLEAEAAEKREQEIQQQEMNEKYTKWGKGLKQVEDREEKLKSDLYEMNKPLARYADDADLDKELREQEREGDPMLEYIKQKQIKEGKRKQDPPQYQGSFAPNRFGIKPGHRWDGVDRSNGYEKKWFESQNAKVARQEEAYKWSTADM
nr:PREDICTED: BUD13 homolog isoform X1 [Linepithema humile]XP_012226815.1 PREDICTED: BUD13 homolog isoform X1 [Linepithema humile]